MADYDPNPEVLDGKVHYCRHCRLFLEEYRTIVAAVERDTPALADINTVEMLLLLHVNLSKHLVESNHSPLRESIKAFLETGLDLIRGRNPDKYRQLQAERARQLLLVEQMKDKL